MFTSLFGLSVGNALGYLEAHKNRERIRRSKKMRITGANTTNPMLASGAGAVTYHSLSWAERMRVHDYVEELIQQAKWDEEKCAKQQSKSI